MPKIFTTIFLTLCLTILSHYSIAQTTRIDSLKKNISTANVGPEKLKALLAFCDEWESFNADTLHKYALLAKDAATETKNKEAVQTSDYYLAAYLFQKNRLDTALRAADEVIAGIKKTTSYNNLYLKASLLKGNILMRTLHYDEVLKQDLALLPLAEKNNDTVAMIRLNTGIGNVNLRLKNNDEALRWHYKAISLMNTDELKAKCSFVYINLSVVYYHLAVANDTKQNEDSIEFNIQRAIQYSRSGNSLTNLANSLSMYGNVLAQYKKIKPAETALNEALETRKKIGDVFYVLADMVALSSLYENSGEYGKAIAVCLSAIELAKQNGGDAASMISIYSSLGEVYSNSHDYKNYSDVLNERMRWLDSLYKVNSVEAIAEMETKYNVQKKENTILQQTLNISNKNHIIYTIAGLGLALLIITWLILKNRRQQQQQKIKELVMENERKTKQAIDNAKEEERKRIIADLHDDVGGGLSTIRMVSDLITEQTRQTLELEQYAHKISSITKDVTQRMNTIVWALNTENDTLQNLGEYIRKYGFGFFENSAIEFTSNLVETEDNIALSGLQRKNLFLCVKEALNNIYKHSGAKKATVHISILNNLLTVTVHDNGKGITSQNAFGNGLRNIEKRMKEINGTVTFNSLEGTVVTMEVVIPVVTVKN